MKTILLFPLLLSLSSLLLADPVEVHTHTYPVEESAYGADWEIRGTHHFRFKRLISVLTSALYEEANGGGERLIFTYTRNIKASDLVDAAKNHLEDIHSPEVLEQYQDLLTQVGNVYTDLEENDSYAITVIPGKGIWIDRDGTNVYYSENADFGDWYLDIWLGSTPINKGLKKGLLDS